MSSVPSNKRQSSGMILIPLLAVALWAFFSRFPPVPDVASFLDGTTRWLRGERLYIDFREINPPLIFYEFVALSFGRVTTPTFAAGVIACSAVSSLWIARHYGRFLGLGVFLSIAFAGMIEFGQREHLLLIFVLPFLLAKGSTVERGAMGIWAFFGLGLKPHFMLIVALPVLIDFVRDRRSVFVAQNVTLGGACLIYLAAVWLAYPIYFNTVIPWARSFYTYSTTPALIVVLQIPVVTLAILQADFDRRRLAAAIVGALACYALQGRYWAYHFIPVAGLTMVLCYWQRRIGLWALMLGLQAIKGPYGRPPSAPVPEGVNRVAIFSSHPSATYPIVVGCGLTNTMRGASVAWIPPAWNIVSNPSFSKKERDKAAALMRRERESLRRDVLSRDTEVIISDARRAKPYFDRNLDYMKFLGPFPGYRHIRTVGYFEIWARGPVSDKPCSESY